MKYPTHNGLPINPVELGYDEEGDYRRTNHHNAWTRQQMGRLLLTRTFRNLDEQQYQLPIHLHRRLHSDYEPPRLNIASVYNEVLMSYEEGKLLRYGTATNYWNEEITKEAINDIVREYGNL